MSDALTICECFARDGLQHETTELSTQTKIALIDASDWTTTSLSGLNDVEATAYDVTSWINAGNEAAFNLALTANADEIEDLHAAIAANASLESWLVANNATADDVVAIGVAADGSLAVFTN